MDGAENWVNPLPYLSSLNWSRSFGSHSARNCCSFSGTSDIYCCPQPWSYWRPGGTYLTGANKAECKQIPTSFYAMDAAWYAMINQRFAEPGVEDLDTPTGSDRSFTVRFVPSRTTEAELKTDLSNAVWTTDAFSTQGLSYKTPARASASLQAAVLRTSKRWTGGQHQLCSSLPEALG